LETIYQAKLRDIIVRPVIKIQIIIGSTREGRRSEMVARWIYDLAKTRKDAEFELLDLRDYPLPFFNEKGSPQSLNDEIPVAKKWRDKVSQADGYIIVSPEYNHGYPAVLKNALDYTYKPWNDKPVGFVSYGSVGGARAIEQLRLVSIELQMAPIETSIGLMKIREIFDENGKMKDDAYSKRVEGLLDNLILWADALLKIRSKSSEGIEGTE